MKLSFPTRRSFELASVTPHTIFSQRDLKEAVPSERLHYGENDDKRGQYARHLIQHPQFLVAEWPKPLCQLFRIANHPSMITGENDHKKEFRVKPALRPGVDIEREHQAEYPDDHERRIENNLPQPTFTAQDRKTVV